MTETADFWESHCRKIVRDNEDAMCDLASLRRFAESIAKLTGCGHTHGDDELTALARCVRDKIESEQAKAEELQGELANMKQIADDAINHAVYCEDPRVAKYEELQKAIDELAEAKKRMEKSRQFRYKSTAKLRTYERSCDKFQATISTLESLASKPAPKGKQP